MKIYYRGYVINQEHPEARCTVLGTRPDRAMQAFATSPQGAMRWIDRDVIRQQIEDTGWLSPRYLPAQ